MSSKGRSILLGAIKEANRRYATATILFHNTVADALRLNTTDYKCVDILNQRGRMAAGELAAITELTTGSITIALDRLEKARLIKRINDPNDRRKVFIELIPDRIPEWGDLFIPMLKAHAELLATYNEDELALILDYTEKTTQMMDEQALDMRHRQKQQKQK